MDLQTLDALLSLSPADLNLVRAVFEGNPTASMDLEAAITLAAAELCFEHHQHRRQRVTQLTAADRWYRMHSDLRAVAHFPTPDLKTAKTLLAAAHEQDFETLRRMMKSWIE